MMEEKKEIKRSSPKIKIQYSFLKILTATDLARRRWPLMSIESPNPGPVIWLTAGSHGDEVSGIVIIQEIFKKIKKTLLRGKIYAIPLLNPIGFENSSRYVTLSEEDLNRSFPGKMNGSLAERMAYKIFNTITEARPSLVLDLHNDWIRSIPFVLLDYDENIIHADAYNKSKTLSQQTGLLPIFDMDEVTRTLSYNLIRKGIPALTLELGEPYIINEKSVELGVNSIMNVLAYLNMVAPIDHFLSYPVSDAIKDKNLMYSHLSSSTSGIVRFFAKPGEIIRRERPVARIYNAFGKLQETIIAAKDGIVLGHADYSVAFPGAPVMSFGNPF